MASPPPRGEGARPAGAMRTEGRAPSAPPRADGVPPPPPMAPLGGYELP